LSGGLVIAKLSGSSSSSKPDRLMVDGELLATSTKSSVATGALPAASAGVPIASRTPTSTTIRSRRGMVHPP
jgi:hypothetical protein